jgi:hypothetical protein
MFKEKQKVIARTVRGTEFVEGRVVKTHPGAKGDWIEVQPDAKGSKSFRTRACCVSPR